MNIIYTMDQFLVEYFGSISIESNSILSVEGKNILIGNVSISTEPDVKVESVVGKLQYGTLSVLFNPTLFAQGVGLQLFGNISILSGSELALVEYQGAINIVSGSILIYNMVYASSSISFISQLYNESLIEYTGVLYDLNESILYIGSNIEHEALCSISFDEDLIQINGMILYEELNISIQFESSILSENRLGYCNYGSLNIENESLFSDNTNILTTGSSGIFSSSSITTNENIIYNGILNISNEILLIVNSQYINSSVYGIINIENESTYAFSGFPFTVGKISIINESLIEADGILKHQYYGSISIIDESIIDIDFSMAYQEYGQINILNGSVIYCSGIIPIRQNIICGIINITISNDITVVDKTIRKNITIDKSIKIKNC